jgi:Domain of unknown function (DUF4157)
LAVSVVDRTQRAAGQPLDAPSRAFSESRFGHDFSHIRVHNGSERLTSTSAMTLPRVRVRADSGEAESTRAVVAPLERGIAASEHLPARLPPRALLTPSSLAVAPAIPPRPDGPQLDSRAAASHAGNGRDVVDHALARGGVPLPVSVRAHFVGAFASAPPVHGTDDPGARTVGRWLIGRPDSSAEICASEAANRAGGPSAGAHASGMGPRFDSVRVHDDRSAARAASALGARAFSLGEDIFFAARQYQPWSSAGRDLIGHELTHVLQAREARPVIMRQVLTEVNEKSHEYLRGYNDGRARSASAPGPLTAGALAEYDAGYSNGLAEATQAQKSLTPVAAVPGAEKSQEYLRGYNDGRANSASAPGPLTAGARADYDAGYSDGLGGATRAQKSLTHSPPDAAEVERITKRTKQLKATYTGNVARPILDRALEPDDYRLTPTEIAKLRTRAESLRQIVQKMASEGFDEDASILSHIIGDLLGDAKLAEVQWRQLSPSAKSYWLMKRDHPEWQVRGNALLDMTGAIVQESQSADVQFVMAIFVDAMAAAPPRRPVTANAKTLPTGPPAPPPKPPALSAEIDKAFADLEAGKIPQGEPAVRVKVRKSGVAAQVGDIGAGPNKVDLGIPPERELVAVERMDKFATGSPDRILDASGTFPPELYGKYDTLIINNPYKYAPNIAELSKGLTPNGKIILQGNWKANSYFRHAADSAGIPPGMTVTVERNVQPLGRGFSYTDTSRAGAPVVDSRITIEFKPRPSPQ